MTSYEQAIQQLSQVPLADFLAERKRLAAELRAHGDEAGAAQIAKRSKPVTSVWVVNQLYWHARDAFDEMFAAAARVRGGDLRATKPHNDAIALIQFMMRVAVEMRARVRGITHQDLDGAASADDDRPIGERMRADGHERHHIERGMHDRPP